MADDLARLEHTPGCAYNFHPGSHVQQECAVAIPYIADMLNEVIKPEQSIFAFTQNIRVAREDATTGS
jgi:deoxyribonuclease-4